MTDLLVLGAVVAATAALAWWWRSRDGRIRQGRGPRLAAADLAALGAPPGVTVLVEFTAPGCRPCVAAREVLRRAAAERGDVSVVLADVGAHLDLARSHGVLRAPTTLVVDPDGRVRHRITGVPDAADVADLLDGSYPARAA